jgi:hypothetical protein
MDEALPPPIMQRATQLASACHAVAREIRKFRGEMVLAGVKFPHALDTELVHLDMSVDSIYIILDKPHLTSAAQVNAENPA